METTFDNNPNLSDIDIYYVMLNLDLKTLFIFCQSYVFAYDTCYSYTFWQDKIKHDFGERYVDTYYESDYWQFNYDDPFNLYLNSMYSYMSNAIKNVDIKSIEYTIRKGFTNWCLALYEAGKFGNQKIIDYFMNKINIQSNPDLKYCISLGAVESENTELLNKYIHSSSDWQDLLIESMKSHNIETFDRVLTHMGNINIDCTYLLEGVAAYGTLDMFSYIINNMHEIGDFDCIFIGVNSSLLKTALYYHNIEMFDELVEWLPKEDITKYIIISIDERNYDFFEHILTKYGNLNITKIKDYLGNIDDLDEFKKLFTSIYK